MSTGRKSIEQKQLDFIKWLLIISGVGLIAFSIYGCSSTEVEELSESEAQTEVFWVETGHNIYHQYPATDTMEVISQIGEQYEFLIEDEDSVFVTYKFKQMGKSEFYRGERKLEFPGEDGEWRVFTYKVDLRKESDGCFTGLTGEDSDSPRKIEIYQTGVECYQD